MNTRRLWEILPGALVWGTFILAVILSFVAPMWVILYVIIFDVYWLFRITYFVLSLSASWNRYRKESKKAWMKEVFNLPKWEEKYHLIFLPTYKEPLEVIRETCHCLQASTFPTRNMFVVLAGEERDKENFLKNAEVIQKEFGHIFRKIFVTVHPAGLPDEIPGKGSNLNYSARTIKPEIDATAIPPENIIVSSFDVDTQVPAEYFAYLTYTYMTVPDPTHSSYQPVPLFNNNMWDSPAPIRVAAFGTTFWLLSELGRPDTLMTFSSHSMPWKMLIDVGFWQKDIVSEDSRIFLQALNHYNGKYRVTPLYMGFNIDAVAAKGYWNSLIALYKQQRRWAWGVENTPYMIEKFFANKKMPFGIKLKFLFFQLEGMYTWATAPLLIFLLGRLPLALASDSSSVLIQSAPYTLEAIMQFATIGVFTSATLSFFLIPHRPVSKSRMHWVTMLLQWLLMPVTFTLFGALPAIDAQTRLMLGKYLGFNVTAKVRK